MAFHCAVLILCHYTHSWGGGASSRYTGEKCHVTSVMSVTLGFWMRTGESLGLWLWYCTLWRPEVPCLRLLVVDLGLFFKVTEFFVGIIWWFLDDKGRTIRAGASLRYILMKACNTYGYTRGKNDPPTPRCFLPRTPTLMILSNDPGPSDYQTGKPDLTYSTFHVS